MSSGTQSQPSLIGSLLGKLNSKVSGGAKDMPKMAMDRIGRLGMSERTQALNRLWAWYRCAQYETRKVDWNGREVLDPLAAEAISTRGFIPPGFVDASGQNIPLKFRRPSAPYGLARVIVDRFTGLLFSEGQHPQIFVRGDAETEDFVRTVADVARLWQQMALARTYGGAMGSVAVGFQFVDGKPVVEVHDPRWCFPEFVDKENNVLLRIEKRYQYPVEERNPGTGKFETVWYWYRRIIDQTNDTVFQRYPVGSGEEPDWQIEQQVEHGLGFCPVVWVQNLPVQEDIDGDPDCWGTFDMMETIDALVAQAQRGILSNCDPTLVITSELEMPVNLQKGSEKALHIPKGDAKYLELVASGPKAALDMAQQLRGMVLEVTQCVLESGPVQHNRTATEVNANFSSMIAKADVMREQYGERCVKPLLEMMWKAAEILSQPKAVPVENLLSVEDKNPNDGYLIPEGQAQALVRSELSLPPVYIDDVNNPGQKIAMPRGMGKGGVIVLKWPDFTRPTLMDALQASQAVTAAKAAGVIDQETAVRFVAKYFDVDDPQATMKKAKQEMQDEQDALVQSSLSTPEAASPTGGFE